MSAAAQRILVVEDENIVAMDLRATLTRLGYVVVDAVGTGRQAIEQVQLRRPDLVLMDIQLRGAMDGIEAAERIRRLEVPVVYLTAFSDDATLRRARETDPHGYVLKPFDDRELQIVIELAIHRHQARTEHDQLLREQAARAAIEKEHRWARFLADASRALSASLDVNVTLDTISRLAIPDLADWAALHVRGKQGVVETVAIHHAHGREEAVREMLRSYPLPPDAPHAYPRVLRTGEPELIAAFTDETLASIALGPENLGLLRSLGLKSQICVPLIVRQEIRAAMTLALAESGGHYDEEDVAHAMDLASRCAIAMENAELFQQAKDAIGLRDDFLSIASHELRTPLATVQLLLQSMEYAAKKIDSTEVASKLKRTLQQVDRLTELVNKLLDVTRIGAGKLELDLEEFDAVPVVQEIVERFAEPARVARSPLQLRHPERLICRADRLRLDQILTNLLGNAIKFGAGEPIDVILQSGPSQLQLTVSDRGIGIPAAHLARIFDRFERAVSSRQYGGLGLGLYITRRIAEAHGGTVRVESAPGAGAAFTVNLPLDAAAAGGTTGDA